MKEDAKPPRIASNPAEREWMRDWVIAKLDAEDHEASGFDEAMKPLLSGDPNVLACLRALVAKQLGEIRTPEFAIAQAKRGNIEPARHLLEKKQLAPLAQLLQPPKFKRGKYLRKAYKQSLIEGALADLPRIRAIWKAAYNGKCTRPEGQITAVEIAAKRWGVSANALRKGIPKKKG
jgi:hypothetical protein